VRTVATQGFAGDGTPVLIELGPSQFVKLLAQPCTTILPEISPATGDHGDETGTKTFEFSAGVTAGPSFLQGSVSGGWSWTQSIFQWKIVAFSTSSEVDWFATVPSGESGCSNGSWIWGYAAAVRVSEGSSPGLTDEFFTGFFNSNNPYERDIPRAISVTTAFPIPPAVSFETNPFVGSIALNGTEYAHGQHAFYVPGTYSATAEPPEDYIFAHWQAEGGLSLNGQNCPGILCRANPITVSLQGSGILKAVFAANNIYRDKVNE